MNSINTNLNDYLSELQFQCFHVFRHSQDDNDLLLAYPSICLQLVCITIAVNKTHDMGTTFVFFFNFAFIQSLAKS